MRTVRQLWFSTTGAFVLLCMWRMSTPTWGQVTAMGFYFFLTLWLHFGHNKEPQS